jgi:putative transposase
MPCLRSVRATYEFIKAHQSEHRTDTMCRILAVARSGFYAWLRPPRSDHAAEHARLLRMIRASFVASYGIYGAPRVFLDPREAGETCSKDRVAQLMRVNGLRARSGYRVRHSASRKPAVLVPNLLQRQFTVARPRTAWVTDITYIRTWQGWLYLAVVIDLFSRRVVGWAAGSSIQRELVLTALLGAVRRRRPFGTVIHSDQGTQYSSDAWRRCCRSHRIEPSMSRKGNCWDNAVVESFFSSLKKERTKKHSYRSRELAIADVAEYIDDFYNRTRATVTSAVSAPSRLKRTTRHAAPLSSEVWQFRKRWRPG